MIHIALRHDYIPVMTTVEDSSRIAIVDDDDLMRSALQAC